MPKGKNQKFKLYRLAQIMLENTDEEHYITMPEIKEKLEEYGKLNVAAGREVLSPLIAQPDLTELMNQL